VERRGRRERGGAGRGGVEWRSRMAEERERERERERESKGDERRRRLNGMLSAAPAARNGRASAVLSTVQSCSAVL